MIIPAEELSKYVEAPHTIVAERCKYATVELAWLWNLRAAEYAADPTSFYENPLASDLYLFDLTLYHDFILEPRGAHMVFRDVVRKYAFQRVLDFGGGIGDWTIQAKEAGAVHVDYVDFDGVSKSYAAWRFDQRRYSTVRQDVGLDARKFDVSLLPKIPSNAKAYDLVVCMDVFEHMKDPGPTIARMAELADYAYCNPDEVPYSWLYPQHVSKVELAPHFERVDGNLWKRARPR